MKTTQTISLNGCAYHIDSDAFELLNDYLEQVRISLGNTDDADEIINDIEARISELFNDELDALRQDVINRAMVKKIMDTMGKPEEYSEQESGQKASTASEQPHTKAKRHLYRDNDNAIIAGVCAGIANYIGWDAVWVRLLFVLLLFVGIGGLSLIVYLVLWAITPKAITTAQKMEMTGKEVSVQSIKSEIEQTTATSTNTPSTARRILSFLLKGMLFCFIGFIGFILVTTVLALIAGLFGAFVGINMATLDITYIALDSLLGAHKWITLACLSVSILCPIVLLIAGMVSYLKNRHWTNLKFNLIGIALWLVFSMATIGIVVWNLSTTKLTWETELEEATFRNMTIAERSSDEGWTCYTFKEQQTPQSIQANGNLHIRIIPSDQLKINIKDGSSPVLFTYKNAQLLLENRPYQGFHDSAEIEIGMPTASNISLGGNTTATTDFPIQAQTVTFELNGNSHLEAEVETEKLSTQINGNSKALIKGNATTAHYQVRGASHLVAADCESDTVEIEVQGASKASVYANKTLKADAKGASEIKYRGNPTVKREAIGASNIFSID
ncbi:MAG: DUF2807 domain-containing protein [Paludibacteraceae bacterium]|nr:DUF2807 domain-containing protein [Paludibacteraceae bacterium]